MARIKDLVKRLNRSSLIVKKKGKKYIVRDAVDDLGGGIYTARQLRKQFS